MKSAGDPFRAAVAAIHAGDTGALEALLDAEPQILQARGQTPEPDPGSYFHDPKLFWYVANNPILVEPTPPASVEIARAMIARGVERSDLDYTLGLVMTGSAAREAGLQLALVTLLMEAGARPSRDQLLTTAGNGEVAVLRTLVERGLALDAPLAASLGELAPLRTLLATADTGDIQTAFGLAVLNHQVEAAQLALAAGADVNAFAPVHSHGTALHHAAASDDVAMIALLLEQGANPEQRDTLWGGTPLEWAIHGGHAIARAALEHASGN